MTNVGVGFIFRVQEDNCTVCRGLYRVVDELGANDGLDNPLVVIQIPEPPPPRETGKRQPSYYAKGFRYVRLDTLHELLDERKALQSETLPIPPWWGKSDAELLAACPRKRWVQIGEEWATPEVVAREAKWRLIEPLIVMAEAKLVSSIAELDALVPARAKAAKIGANQIYDALHRYYAFGQNKDALLPNTPNRGGKGSVRFGRNGIRLGAPNQAKKVGNKELEGKICDEQDRQNIRDGFFMFARPGVSQKEQFIAFSSTFYSDGYKNENGRQLPLLLPANQRPTEREFFFHGPNSSDRETALVRIMGEGEWAKNYRPLVGSARDGIHAIGQVGSIDASPIDVNLVACFDSTSPIGVPRGLFVREALLGLWCGAHNVIGGPSTADANLTILRAALGKEKVLARLGLSDISPDDFSSFLFTRLLSDNGELRAIAGMEACAKKVRVSIEFVESGRADRNSPSEGGHHARHAGIDHKLPGTTYGRKPKRGEVLPIRNALLSLFGYERLLWQWMHWANTKQRVPHLVPTEMKRAMAGRSYNPTRIEIYRWAEREGYVSKRPVDELYLRSNLLPTYTASVQRNGLVLHRPDTGNRVELLKDALFNSEYIEQSCLYHNFAHNELRHVEVKVDPDDLSEILLVDAQGIHPISNISRDVIVVREYYVADLIASNEANRLNRVETQSEDHQAVSDQRMSRLAEVDDARENRKSAEAEGRRTEAKVKRERVRENQRQEKAAQLDQATRRVANQNTSPATEWRKGHFDPVGPAASNVVSISSSSKLKSALTERLTKFQDTGR